MSGGYKLQRRALFARDSTMIYEIIDTTDGRVITDGRDKDKVIERAKDWLYECERWGEEDCILRITDPETDNATDETITLNIVCEDDGYDGGRWDYYSSR